MSRTSASVFAAASVRKPTPGRAGARFRPVRALAVAIPLLLAASPAGAATVVRTSPRLTPSYSAGTPDYTVRCKPGKPVAIEVRAARGTRVTLDGGRGDGRSFGSRRPLLPGQAFGFQVR